MKSKKKYRYLGKNEIVRVTDELKREIDPCTGKLYVNSNLEKKDQTKEWISANYTVYVHEKVQDCFGLISGKPRIFRRIIK